MQLFWRKRHIETAPSIDFLFFLKYCSRHACASLDKRDVLRIKKKRKRCSRPETFEALSRAYLCFFLNTKTALEGFGDVTARIKVHSLVFDVLVRSWYSLKDSHMTSCKSTCAHRATISLF